MWLSLDFIQAWRGRMLMNRGVFLIGILGSILPALAGCERGVKVASPDQILTVPVSHPVQKEVTDYVDYTGRTNARDSVIIQPRVTGYLVEVRFREGQFVEKDKILFKIDPKPYEAQLEAAQAAVDQNKAALKYAKETNELYKGISKDTPKAVNPRELGQYQA